MTLVESFEDQAFDGWGTDSSLGGTGFSGTGATDGSYAARLYGTGSGGDFPVSAEAIIWSNEGDGLADYPSQGKRYTVDLYPANNLVEAYVMWGSTASGVDSRSGYYFDATTGEIYSTSSSRMATFSKSWQGSEITMELEWYDNGTQDITVTDRTNNTTDQLSYTDTDFTSGGVAFYIRTDQSGNQANTYVDNLRIEDPTPNAPTGLSAEVI